MIALQNTLEGQLWQIILDGYGYDCDTHLFLRGIRQAGLDKASGAKGGPKWKLKKSSMICAL